MKFKKLAIFSDCVHYFDPEGNVVTQNPIFCKQMQALSALFETTLLFCPFDTYRPGMTNTRYDSPAMSFYPLPSVGGNRVADKLSILKVFPRWFRAYRKACAESDLVYQRFPNNLNIPGAIYFRFKGKPVFGTYTGTWDDYQGEPISFRFQKWFLHHYFRGPAGVYSTANPANGNLFPSFSPSFTTAEWHTASLPVAEKAASLLSRNPFIPIFVSAGALVKSKNQQYILDSFLPLHKEGFDFRLYIAGDGPLREAYALFIAKHGLSAKVFLTGMLDEGQMKSLYRSADFVLQASLVEGYGKVPVEGFFYGAVPILHEVSLASEITGNGLRGWLFDACKAESLTLLLKDICSKPADIIPKAAEGRAYALRHTMEAWVMSYYDKIDGYFGK